MLALEVQLPSEGYVDSPLTRREKLSPCLLGAFWANAPSNESCYKCLKRLVGETGFEPATLCSQSRCATRLRYSPTPFRPALPHPPRWARQDSNPRPSRYERPALTAELQARGAGAGRQATSAPTLLLPVRQAGKMDLSAGGSNDVGDARAANFVSIESGIGCCKPLVERLDSGSGGGIGRMAGRKGRAVE